MKHPQVNYELRDAFGPGLTDEELRAWNLDTLTRQVGELRADYRAQGSDDRYADMSDADIARRILSTTD